MVYYLLEGSLACLPASLPGEVLQLVVPSLLVKTS